MKEHRRVFTTWLMDKDIPTKEMTMKMLTSRPSSYVTSWQSYDINGYTYYTKEKDGRSVAQNSGIRIEAFDYGARLQILWVHTRHMGTRLRREIANTCL
jgi:uncharacterized FAD-dependent dehydrogenase